MVVIQLAYGAFASLISLAYNFCNWKSNLQPTVYQLKGTVCALIPLCLLVFFINLNSCVVVVAALPSQALQTGVPKSNYERPVFTIISTDDKLCKDCVHYLA